MLMRISAIGCALLALCLCACGGSDESTPEIEQNSSATLDPWPDFSNQETVDAILAEAVDKDTLKEKDGISMASDGQAPFDGWSKGLYPSGQAAILERYKAGKLDGQTFWFQNGQKKREGRFRNGARDGVWIDWNEDGSARRLVTFPLTSD